MRERILGMGSTGSGKTYAALTIAQYFKDNKEWAKVAKQYKLPSDQIECYIIDPENRVERLMRYFGGKDAFPNVTVLKINGDRPASEIYTHVYGSDKMRALRLKSVDAQKRRVPIDPYKIFDMGLQEVGLMSWVEAQRQIIADATKQHPANVELPHWFMLDMVSKYWDYFQAEYAASEYGHEAMGELLYANKLKEETKKLGGFEGRSEWPIIKQRHTGSIEYMIERSPCNVYATTSISDSPVDGSGKPLLQKGNSILQHHNLKPDGEKHLPHMFDRGFYFSVKGRNFNMEIVKASPPMINGAALKSERDWTDQSFWEVMREYEEYDEAYIPGWSE